MEIILPKYENVNITKNLINSFELSIYKKEINNISLNINRYASLKDLDNLFKGARKLKKDNYEHQSKRGFIYKHIVYQLNGGKISVKCDKWDKDTGIKDSLVFDIYSKKLSNWLNTKAYK